MSWPSALGPLSPLSRLAKFDFLAAANVICFQKPISRFSFYEGRKKHLCLRIG